MISFLFSILVLIIGYFVYGKFIEKIFRVEQERETPVVRLRDDIDFMPLPTRKIFLIRFLNILETFIPDAQIILWKKSKATVEVKNLLKNNFPNVKVIYGNVDKDYKVESPDVIEAFDRADIMAHESGPSVVGRVNLEAWRKHSQKPYGIFGTTIEKVDEDLKKLLKGASFIYTRETKSLEIWEKEGISGDHISFAPDATFFMNIQDKAKASEFLSNNELEDKKFICVVPRLRLTPIINLGQTMRVGVMRE